MAASDESETEGGRPRVVHMDDPAARMGWHEAPRRFLRTILVVSAAIAFATIGITNWLKHEWENAPTRYPDGRIEYRHQPR